MGRVMKEYDVIAIGSGSASSLISAMLQPGKKAALIDKDEPGGICLTRGCIPSKILLYPAEMVRTIQRASVFGIKVSEPEIDFKFVMDRMRRLIGTDIDNIRRGLTNSRQIERACRRMLGKGGACCVEVS